MTVKLSKPGRWLWGGFLLLMFTTSLFFALPAYQARELRLEIEEHNGRVMQDCQLPDWLKQRLPQFVHRLFDSVEIVELSYCKLNGEELDRLIARLDCFDELEVLRLNGTELNGDSLRRVADLPDLICLDISHTRVGDRGLQHLSRLAQLEELNLTGTQITDSGLPALRSMKQLDSLALDNTAVTDQGLMSMPELMSLRILNVSNTEVSEEGVALLMEKLPGLNVWDD